MPSQAPWHRHKNHGSCQRCDPFSTDTALDWACMQHVLQLAHMMDYLSTGHALPPSSLDNEVLHGLDQAALDVARGTGLDSSVNQTLTTTHGVEEKLLQAAFVSNASAANASAANQTCSQVKRSNRPAMIMHSSRRIDQGTCIVPPPSGSNVENIARQHCRNTAIQTQREAYITCGLRPRR